MFITQKAFRALIKQAYTGAGLTVGRRENRLLFCGSYWGIEVVREALPNKSLAAVIELTGELPEDGGLFKATKEGGIQYEIPETYWDITAAAEQTKDCYKVSNVMVQSKDKVYRVLQAESKQRETQLINNLFVDAVDPKEMNFEYESYIEGPLAAGTNTYAVYWKNEACVMAAFLMRKEDMKENELLEFLKRIDLEE